ncbi:MAG TPA: hypothetical protein VIX39_03720, partial [Actinomycetota bacterium]
MSGSRAEREPGRDERADAAGPVSAPSSHSDDAIVADGAPATGGEADAATTPASDSGDLARQFAAAAEKSGLGALARDERLTGRDLLGAVGGVRGILEALLPGLVFL